MNSHKAAQQKIHFHYTEIFVIFQDKNDYYLLFYEIYDIYSTSIN